MLEPLPPRRDPRILLVDPTTVPTTYAALDAWEVRGLGELPRRSASRALFRLALQVRPSHVVVLRRGGASPRSGLAQALRALQARGLAVLHPTPAELARLRRLAPTPSTLTKTFPELRHLDLTEARGTTLRLTFAALAHLELPHRRYVSRLAPRPKTPLAR